MPATVTNWSAVRTGRQRQHDVDSGQALPTLHRPLEQAVVVGGAHQELLPIAGAQKTGDNCVTLLATITG